MTPAHDSPDWRPPSLEELAEQVARADSMRSLARAVDDLYDYHVEPMIDVIRALHDRMDISGWNPAGHYTNVIRGIQDRLVEAESELISLVTDLESSTGPLPLPASDWTRASVARRTSPGAPPPARAVPAPPAPSSDAPNPSAAQPKHRP
ncbi:hypothetical protein [Allostreptomyces psammosilenae]|uniref:Uncharacterized protein n=1 Tax=Allostreptomyces psammosilenae TaxID=1892865 RepID=A0A852ZM06_9ACTN|nr:hypothetical protein [Allostreptomyces psammosilenae]NYI03433.1 hypothetical protein [Allostreptomyces psammosilenae]